ncbi:inositol monophosphatase family protein [Pelagibius sp.]|uniref:inositol monophosphatase family protein n=1 Tax=Pelagibius sp. TaxID=1931238 RepID=UPI00261AC0E4|nr:inositol monophosphatase family protein [Pelagibius sp.]
MMDALASDPSALTRRQEDALIALLRDVAKAEILPRFRRLATDDIRAKTAPDDLVTEADLAAEAAITAGVRELLPAAAVIGEEAVSADPSLLNGIGGGLAVILDPIDGTWNFANGLAVFGVILAVAVEGETVFGLLYDPLLDDWVLARKGGGAWFCRPGEEPFRLSVGPAVAPEEMTGFVPLFTFPRARRPAIAQAITDFRRAPSLRCSCHEYRLLAQGRADFIVNAQLNAWDHAAGVLAVQEAGGHAELLDGRPYDCRLTEGNLLVAKTEASIEALRARFAGPLGATG